MLVIRAMVLKLMTLLTPSSPAVPNCCCLNGPVPYWSNPPFLVFDIPARAPECHKLKMVGQTSMAKSKALTGSAVKGLTSLVVRPLLKCSSAGCMYE